ncbi:ATP-binding cassette domain-containing protein [Paeniglutamicibacter antarcticus]|uniref:ATP-binding cassette domain-containing protein n=1 Tax=Arthrobacter terrae TaxID=2935737 RepID=A0A931CPZ7_9MICC|nr:ATP-binding cassette domain-containing protein [Arthrobacter terrae]MBG0740255.1 ATP-binding cassette domain-containing protein [Arthrobacter terrae]
MTAEERSAELAIETRGLTKTFGHQVAVNGIDLAVPRGAVFGFLGPNGSGKTTTIRMLLGLAAATSGQARVLGRDMPRSLREVLPLVGALIEGPAFYPFLSGAANLHRLDTADRDAPSRTRAARVHLALERVGLTQAAGKKVRAYSLGMKQRLGIANALLAPRELLVLDEPTNGLDPQGTREVRALVRLLAAGGTTVFVSSHLLGEVEQMCTHAAVMSAGRLVAQGTLDELRRSGTSRVQVRTPDAEAARRVLAGLGLAAEDAGRPAAADAADGLVTAVLAVHPGGPDLAGGPVYAAGLQESLASGRAPKPEEIVCALVAAGVRVRGFAVLGSSLEDRFVALTGEGFDVAQ